MVQSTTTVTVGPTCTGKAQEVLIISHTETGRERGARGEGAVLGGCVPVCLTACECGIMKHMAHNIQKNRGRG